MSEVASIKEIQDTIIEDFSFLEDWDEKYGYIIELGKKQPPLSEEYKTESNKIRGCQSQVWLHSYLNGNKVIFEGDSDAVIVKGLVSLMIKVLSGHPPEEILETELYLLDKIGMKQHLSPLRSNGLASMIKQMKLHALAYKAKLSNNS